jgi:hypothetical protein
MCRVINPHIENALNHSVYDVISIRLGVTCIDMSARILRGFDSIVNMDNVRPAVDLRDLEQRMIDGGISLPNEAPPEDRFKNELREVAERVGISFDDIPATTAPQYSLPTPTRSSFTPTQERSPYERSRSDDAYAYTSTSTNPYTSTRPPTPPQSHNESSSDNLYGVESLRERTDEQERRSHIEQVVGDGPGAFNMDALRNDDLKCAHLAEIDSLMTSLQNEEVDTSRLPKVDSSSSFDEVVTALKIWRHRSDSLRCTSFAEEGLVLLAHLLSDLFDGKTTYFGRFRPDMTGYHNHMHSKLKRIRPDTGAVVSNMISAGGIGPGLRIAMELIPNMLIYSKQRKMHNEAVGDFMDDESTTEGVRAL